MDTDRIPLSSLADLAKGSVRNTPRSSGLDWLDKIGQALQGAIGDARNEVNIDMMLPYLGRVNVSPYDLLGKPGDAMQKISRGQRVLPTMTQPMDPDLIDLAGIAAPAAVGLRAAGRGLVRELTTDGAGMMASGSRASQAGEVKLGGKGKKKPPTPDEINSAIEKESGAVQKIKGDADTGTLGELRSVTRSKDRIAGGKNAGQFVGAPKGIDTPEKFEKMADEYANRIEEAFANGVPRGYFYKEGSKINNEVADSARDRARLAMTEGVTSSEAPVMTNTGWAIKAIEQDAMGAPVHTGKYPNANKAKVERVLGGDFSHIGTKTHRYAGGLNADPVVPPPKDLPAPNDRWEIRSMGYEGDTAGDAQHAFMDKVRARGVEKYNARHPEKDPLSILEGQEANWATQRARDMKIPHAEAAESIQDAIKAHTFQHSWESRGGEKAKHLNDVPADQLDALHERVKGVLIDPQGKDNLIRAMGGRLQRPSIDGPGVYEGVVSPGTQSRSLVYKTNDAGLDPTSGARVNATEAIRAWMLGQDAFAGHALNTPKTLSGPKTDTLAMRFGRTPTREESISISSLLDAKTGGGAGMVPAEDGFNVLRFNDDPKFSKTMASDVTPEIMRILGQKVETTPAARAGIYGDLGWEKGTATKDMLGYLDNPAAPNLPGLADSPETRALMQKMGALLEDEMKAGRTPNPKLLNAIKVYAQEGLEGLRALDAKGLAPAVGGVPLLGYLLQGEQQPDQ